MRTTEQVLSVCIGAERRYWIDRCLETERFGPTFPDECWYVGERMKAAGNFRVVSGEPHTCPYCAVVAGSPVELVDDCCTDCKSDYRDAPDGALARQMTKGLRKLRLTN